MDKKENEIVNTHPSPLETELTKISEDQLPVLLTERIKLLSAANTALTQAKEQEQEANTNINTAIQNANQLIAEAKTLGMHKAEPRQFLFFEYLSDADRLDAVEANLKEMITHHTFEAQANKELAELHKVSLAAITATLKVNEAQMAYQAHIADTSKFLYGLCAYNMASIQSVLINLEAVLSGASKEELGELAKQQLLLAMDQLKNQESLVLKSKENRELIDCIDLELSLQEKTLKDVTSKNSEQDQRLQAGEEYDRQQDLIFTNQFKKAEEEIAKHSSVLMAQADKDNEHSHILQTLQEQVALLQQNTAEQVSLIATLQAELDAQKQTAVSKSKLYIAYIVSGISLILALISFFI